MIGMRARPGRTTARLAAVAAGLAVVTACGNPGFPAGHGAGRYLAPVMSARPASYLGVYEPGVPRSYRLVGRFGAAVGHRPNLVLYYSSWGEPFQLSFAVQAAEHGAATLVQMDPGNAAMAAIAAGRYDHYLRTFAAAVRRFGRPVVIGFAREMNGWWYPWGQGHVPERTWIAAWRHLVTVFRAAGADNVTWQWTINSLGTTRGGQRSIGLPRWWWPGAGYVTWVGIDGYYYNRFSTFASVFGSTIAAVRRFTNAPILLSEVGVSPGARPSAALSGLFAGLRADHALGLVWFDAPARRDWRLEDAPALLAAFHAQVSALFGGH